VPSHSGQSQCVFRGWEAIRMLLILGKSSRGHSYPGGNRTTRSV
jgi:hypothetical protein